jgi:DNA repair protein RecO (recombination protein O)
VKARDRALILRRYPYGESSLLVHALTPGRGRTSLLAKGAYRLHSGYFGALDLFDTLLVGFQARPGAELSLLSSAEIDVRRKRVSASLERYAAALACLELAWLGAREGEEEQALFHLTETALDLLEAGDVPPRVVECAFELHFLRERGWSPVLESCVACGQTLAAPPRSANATGAALFSPSEGGQLCPACATVARARRAAVTSHPWRALRVASSLLETPLAHLTRVRLEPGIARQVLDFVRRFVEYHLETRPRSFEASTRPPLEPSRNVR